MDDYKVIFNSNNLGEVDGVWLYYYNATDLPDRDINIHKLARRSLSIVTSAEYTQKTIPVMMRVCSGSRQATEDTITRIKGLLQPQNGELIVYQSGEDFKYTATMNEFNIEWVGTSAYVVIVFIASTPIAEAVDTDIMTNFNTTLASDGSSFIVNGSYIAEPIINVTINSVTGGSGSSVSIFNASTNQGITVTGNFTAGSQLEIDCSQYTVRLNGVNMDFEGLFPTFPPGAQRIGYSDTFTTRDVDVTVTYNKQVV